MTVAELIAELAKYPADTQVAIEDADTQWLIRKIHLGYGGVYVTIQDTPPSNGAPLLLWGEYHEMEVIR